MFLEAPGQEDPQFYVDLTKPMLERYDGPLDVVVDLGAHVGTFSIQAVHDYKAKFVLAVEADLRNFDYLLGNIAGNGYEDKIFPILGTISNQSFNSLVLRAAKTSGQRSLLFANHFPGKPVLTISMADILEMVINRFGYIDFLKVDIEGAEWTAFKDNRLSNLLSKVCYLDIEFHPQEDEIYYDMLEEKQIDQLTKELRQYGFFNNPNATEWEFYGYRHLPVL
jgi:FkbM family methyltransferase